MINFKTSAVIKNGFTLIEVLLVIGVMLSIVMIKAKDVSSEIENAKAEMLAGQIKTVAQATNALLVLKYNELSSLSLPNVSCNTSNQTCDVPLSVLKNNFLLPSNFSSKIILSQDYLIQLKRTGISPNYMFEGVVLTKGYEGNNAKNILPSFLGKTVSYIGKDGGLNKETGKMSGNAGGWNTDSVIMPILTGKKDYIGSSVGTLSGAYYVYLRRDGTLPMTGDLNLDNHNINNVNDLNVKNVNANGVVSANTVNSSGAINAQGQIYAKGNIASDKEVFAKNGMGDSIALGGDAFGADYEIRLGTAKPLTIFSPTAASYTTILQTGTGNVKFGQRLGLMGTDPNALPAGWHGGLTTLDVYANGTVAAGSGGGISAYLNSAGDVYAQRNLDAGYVYSRGNINASGNIDANYVHSRGNVDSAGRINAGEFFYVGGVANEGWGCAPNGLIGKNSVGALMSCQSGVWRGTSVRNTGIAIYQCPYSICDNNSASTCAGQLSTKSYCQCRQSGGSMGCTYVGNLIVQ